MQQENCAIAEGLLGEALCKTVKRLQQASEIAYVGGGGSVCQSRAMLGCACRVAQEADEHRLVKQDAAHAKCAKKNQSLQALALHPRPPCPLPPLMALRD
jgi:hypothetical protein